MPSDAHPVVVRWLSARRVVGPCIALAVLLAGSTAWAGFQIVPTAGMADRHTCIGISHRDPNFVMIGTSRGTLLRTTDGGKTWQEIEVTPDRTLFYGRQRYGDPRLQYALGLPGKSPLLQRWLRSKGLHTSGINLQQLLVQKGDKAVSITWIEVDWHDENRVYVGTVDGLYRSVNKGRSFLRIWQGRRGMSDRVINAVVTDPAIPGLILVGTARGLYRSKDSGVTFKKEMSFYIRNSYIRALYYDREYKGLVHMAMGGAAMASPDSGKNWITTYWHLWGPRSSVQWISLGPKNVRLIGTRDGVWASAQGGEMGTWQRRGRRFVGRRISSVLVTKNPMVWFATTPNAVWRTVDAGLHWRKVMQLGGNEYPVWMDAYANDTGQLWMITNRHVYRWGGVPNRRVRPSRSRSELLDIPSLDDLWRHIVRVQRIYYKDLQAYRDRGPWAALLPNVYARGVYAPTIDRLRLSQFPFLKWPYRYFNVLQDQGFSFQVIALWDLTRLVFDRRQLPSWGRIDRNLRYIRQDLTSRVQRLYTEYVSLARRRAAGEAADPMARIFEGIRMDEISAFFDVISRGYWGKQLGSEEEQ